MARRVVGLAGRIALPEDCVTHRAPGVSAMSRERVVGIGEVRWLLVCGHPSQDVASGAPRDPSPLDVSHRRPGTCPTLDAPRTGWDTGFRLAPRLDAMDTMIDEGVAFSRLSQNIHRVPHRKRHTQTSPHCTVLSFCPDLTTLPQHSHKQHSPRPSQNNITPLTSERSCDVRVFPSARSAAAAPAP